MADFILPDGREVVFDLNCVPMNTYRLYIRGKLTDEQDDDVLAQASGITADVWAGLSQVQYRRAVRAFVRKANEPLLDTDDPKVSASESIDP